MNETLTTSTASDATGQMAPAKDSTKRKKRRLTWDQIKSRYVGKKFVHRKQGKQQTWRVVDVTLGGDVVVRDGPWRVPVIPQDEFLEWMCHAKEVEKQ